MISSPVQVVTLQIYMKYIIIIIIIWYPNVFRLACSNIGPSQMFSLLLFVGSLFPLLHFHLSLICSF